MKIRFGNITFDADSRQLWREREPLHLSPKAFDLLALLIERRPAVVDKATLRQHLWPDTHVLDANLGNLVSEVRTVLGEGSPLIRTAHGVGYAVDGAGAEVEKGSETEPAAGTRFWVVVNQRAIVLAQDDNVIGRDPACAIWVEADGVSRRHARIQLKGQGAERRAALEDLASTNGKFLGKARVEGAEPLKDGDLIRVGGAKLTFREWKDSGGRTKKVRKVPGSEAPKGRRS